MVANVKGIGGTYHGGAEYTPFLHAKEANIWQYMMQAAPGKIEGRSLSVVTSLGGLGDWELLAHFERDGTAHLYIEDGWWCCIGLTTHMYSGTGIRECKVWNAWA